MGSRPLSSRGHTTMDRLPLQHSIRDALGGRYHVRHEIGHGAMATVFLAEAQGTGDSGGRQGAPPGARRRAWTRSGSTVRSRS